MVDALRMASDEANTIEGWAVPFDGSFNDGRDSYGTYFSARTDFRLDWYKERPLLWHHGLDKDVGLTPVGVVRSMEMRDKGVWMKAQLDAQSEYFDAIRQLVKDGKVFLSSGSVEHLVRIDARTGHVEIWPIVEQTLTTTPSNLLADIPVRNFRAAVRADLPHEITDEHIIVHNPIRAVWSTAFIDALPNSSFAYVEPNAGDDKSKRHLPYKDKDGKPDAAHVRNALARLDATDIPAAAKARAKRKLLAAAKELGIEVADESSRSAKTEIVVNGTRYVRADMGDDDAPVTNEPPDASLTEKSFEDIAEDINGQLNPAMGYGPFGPGYAGCWFSVRRTFADHVIVCQYEPGEDETYWRIPYTINDALEPVLAPMGEWTQVQEAFIPVARAADVSVAMGLEAHRFATHAAAFVRYTEGLDERRYREGRMLSASNLQTVSDIADGLEAHAKTLRDLHQRATERQQEAARVAYWADPDAQAREIALLEHRVARLIA